MNSALVQLAYPLQELLSFLKVKQSVEHKEERAYGQEDAVF